jgi:hypothetical protein
MVLIKKEHHTVRGNNYELLVYQVQESHEYRVYVAKDGFGVGDIFTSTQETINDAGVGGQDVVENLLAIAKDDLDRNEFGLY